MAANDNYLTFIIGTDPTGETISVTSFLKSEKLLSH